MILFKRGGEFFQIQIQSKDSQDGHVFSIHDILYPHEQLRTSSAFQGHLKLQTLLSNSSIYLSDLQNTATMSKLQKKTSQITLWADYKSSWLK